MSDIGTTPSHVITLKFELSFSQIIISVDVTVYVCMFVLHRNISNHYESDITTSIAAYHQSSGYIRLLELGSSLFEFAIILT